MRQAALAPVALLIATLSLTACGQKGPLCLRDPPAASVPASSAPAAGASSGSVETGSAPAPVSALPASAPAAATPIRPLVPGYTRCH
jgi:predicted small lipoprotein YifL